MLSPNDACATISGTMPSPANTAIFSFINFIFLRCYCGQRKKSNAERL